MKRSGARIHCGTPRDLSLLARRLRAGELVAVPTETVYGLAADAFNAGACRRIFSVKRRPATDPLIVHIASVRDLSRVAAPNEAALRLAKAFWPGPLTIVLPKNEAVPDVVSAGLPSVAVRLPAHPLFRRLIRLAGTPLAAPSANPFGYVSPTTADHVQRGLGGRIRHILDGGPSRVGLESTIVDLRNPSRPRLLRPGGISHQEIVRVLGIPVARPRRKAGSAAPQVAPGQLARHYSPRAFVVLHERLPDRAGTGATAGEAWLFLRKPARARGKNIYWLSPRGELPQAARNLFAALRRMDEAGYSRIHAELSRAPGLGEAINDRLRRAAAR